MAKSETPAEKPKPRISVLDRRLQNPFGEPSSPVDLKDRRLIARWFNGAIIADKIWRAKQKGWTPVRPDDVVDLDQIGGFTKSPDGFVARGDRCQEVLMQMPKEDFDLIQMAKTKHNLRNMGNPGAMKAEVVEAAGQQFGDRAADFLNKSRPVGNVTDQYERIERRDEVE
jgi:hypothetical protein